MPLYNYPLGKRTQRLHIMTGDKCILYVKVTKEVGTLMTKKRTNDAKPNPSENRKSAKYKLKNVVNTTVDNT